jgi:DNA primase
MTMVPGVSDVASLLESIGLTVTKEQPDRIWAHCPMPQNHASGMDRNASWSINPETGAHLCFSCGYRGSLRSLVQDVTGEVPQDLDRQITITKVHRLKYEHTPVEVVPDHPYVSEAQLRSYREVPEKLCRLRKLDAWAVDLYGVRWDTEDKCWVIPIRAFDGTLLGWQQKAKGWFNNVPPAMKKSESLFGLDVFDGQRAVLVESPLDVVRLASAGVPGGLATYGAYVSMSQTDELVGRARSIVLAMDNDKAGREATAELLARLSPRIPTWSVVYLPSDPKDVGDFESNAAVRSLIAEAKRVHR